MDAAKQAQLALLKQLHDEGMLNAEQYRAKVAALAGKSATFDQREQRVQQQVNAGRDAVDGNGHRTTYTYDVLDRLETVTNAEEETTGYVYDKVGNQTELVEPDGVVTHYEYDGVYRLSAVTLNYRLGEDADNETNVTYHYEYDSNGNLVRVVLPPNAQHAARDTQYAYDELNRLAVERDPLENTWTYEYDGVGNLVQRVDANDHATTYAYYPDDQLQRVDYDDGACVAYTYDENNNRTAMTDTLGVTTWVYDPLNRATAVTDPFNRTLGYGYDPVGNRTGVTYPVTGTVQYAYYDNNWLKIVTDPQGYRTTYERDGVGQMLRTLNPNDTLAEATYDDANRLLTLTNRRTGGEIIAAFTYTVNEVGLRTQMAATYGWRNPPVVVEDYAYDPLRRLTGVSDSEGFQSVYEYDAVGNRTRWWANDDQITQQPRDGFDLTYEYDAADRLLWAGDTHYTYDANGNRINANWPGPQGPHTQGVDYTYDRENRLVVAQAYQTNVGAGLVSALHRTDREVTRLFYDGLGRRLAKEYDPKDGGGGVKRTEYVYDGLDPSVEYSLWNGQRDEFYRGAGAQLLTLRHFPAGTAGQSYWYHLDGRGSVSGLTKQQGQSTHNYRYDAYGQLLPAHGNFTDPHNHYTFSGKEWDEYLDSYEFGYRQYDPAAGVWLTQDPLRGEPQRPRTLHRYQYVFASPISYRNPYGLQVEPPGCEPGEICYTGTTGPYNVQSVPYTSLPTGARWVDACQSYTAWRTEVLENLMNAGPYGQHAAEYLIANETRFRFSRQGGSGARWSMDKNIYLNPDYYSLDTNPAAPYMLSLIAHEAKHLEQGPVVALSVYGELEAWQVHHEVYKELMDDPKASLGTEWDELSALPLNYSRSNLKEAEGYMKDIGGPGYHIEFLPLYPALMEIGYWNTSDYGLLECH